METYQPKLTFQMRFSRFILSLFNWKVVANIPTTKKFVIVGGFHTSNWDFPLALLTMWGMGVKLHFVGKQILVNNPFGWIMKYWGIVAVDRSKPGNFVQQMAKLFEERDELRLTLAAEGTRSKQEYWKTGFYYMALEAKVPIVFAYIDSVTRTSGIDGYYLIPSGDMKADFRKVIAYFEGKEGLKPNRQEPVRFRILEEENHVTRTDTEHRF